MSCEDELKAARGAIETLWAYVAALSNAYYKVAGAEASMDLMTTINNQIAKYKVPELAGKGTLVDYANLVDGFCKGSKGIGVSDEDAIVWTEKSEDRLACYQNTCPRISPIAKEAGMTDEVLCDSICKGITDGWTRHILGPNHGKTKKILSSIWKGDEKCTFVVD